MRRLMNVAGSLALLGLLASSPAFAASWPRWAREAGAVPVPEDFADADALLLLDHWEIELDEGRRSGTRRWVLRVLTQEGSEQAAFTLQRGSFDRFSKVRVWVRSPGGRVARIGEKEGLLFSTSSRMILDDSEVLVLQPAGVTPGSLVAVEYRFVSEPDILQDVFRIQGGIPGVRTIVSVTNRREGWTVHAALSSGSNPGPEQVSGKGVWEFRDTPAMGRDEDPYAPAPPRQALALNYFPPGGESSFVDWGQTALWAEELFRLPEGAQPRLEEALARLGQAEGDLVEATGHLVRELRYFGIEIGWGGYRPRPPELTLTRAFGDCKDKSQLMVALLRRSGIEAYPVLAIAATDRYVHDDLPGPRQFNHCIVGIPWEGRERRAGMSFVEAPGLGELRVYDPTVSDSSPQDIPTGLEGGAGLVVSRRSTGLVRFPGSSAEDNRSETRFRVEIDGEGDARVEMTERFSGALRSWLEGADGEFLDAEQLRRIVFREATERCPGFSRLELGRPESTEEGIWTYRVSFQCPAALARFGELGALHLFPHHGMRDLPLPGTETEDSVYWPLLATRIEVYEIAFPGRRLVSRPQDFSVENPLGRFAFTIEEEGESLVLERALVISSLEIPSSQRYHAERLRQALRRGNSASLVFETAPVESP